jgi:hypothetical protein
MAKSELREKQGQPGQTEGVYRRLNVFKWRFPNAGLESLNRFGGASSRSKEEARQSGLEIR